MTTTSLASRRAASPTVTSLVRLLASISLVSAATTGCATASSASSKAPLQTVQHVDLPRYMGDWYVIAAIPYFAEKGKVATIERYALRSDGRIDNTFVFRKGSLDAPEKEWHAVANVVNKTTNAEWKVQFIWPIKLSYAVTDLDPEYRWAAVGHPSRKYFWVLSRERTLDDGIYRAILARAEAQGFLIQKIEKVLQPTSP